MTNAQANDCRSFLHVCPYTYLIVYDTCTNTVTLQVCYFSMNFHSGPSPQREPQELLEMSPSELEC